MYDPVETDVSNRYLGTIVHDLRDGIALIGGWAVYHLVKERYRTATGYEYLRSRDIDLIMAPDPGFVERFGAAIYNMGFVKDGMHFRYQLIIDRDSGSVLREEQASLKGTFEIVYLYLDVFSWRTVALGTWVIPELERAFEGRTTLDGIPVVLAQDVLKMKTLSFKERKNPEKRIKDACDIYALLHYSNLNEGELTGDPVLELMASDYSERIAEHLFRDINYGGIVKRNLESLQRRISKK